MTKSPVRRAMFRNFRGGGVWGGHCNFGRQQLHVLSLETWRSYFENSTRYPYALDLAVGPHFRGMEFSLLSSYPVAFRRFPLLFWDRGAMRDVRSTGLP